MIIFNDWEIRISGLLGRQFDNLTRRIDVVGVPEGWTWDVMIKVGNALDVIALFPTDEGVGIELTRDQLSVGGVDYVLQLRGRQGEKIRHTNVVQTYVPESLSGDGKWPTIPSEFTQLEQRISEIANHPPIPGEDGFWQLWNPDTDQYEDSEFPLPEGGAGGYSDSVRYGESQDLTEEQQLQARKNIGAGTSDFSGSYKDLKDKPEIPTVPVQSVNGKTGAVQLTAKDVGAATAEEVSKLSDDIANLQTSGLTTEQVNALDGMFKIAAYTVDATAAYSAFKTAFGIENSGETEPDEPVEPDTPEVTLTSISAVYNGGDVAVGTAVNDLTGIVVTAAYSDGSTETVTGYTLSGTIAEGSNTITVSYGGMTTTFTVTGVAESGGEESEPFVNLFTANLRKTTEDDVAVGIGTYINNYVNTDSDIQLTAGVTYYAYSLFSTTPYGLTVFVNDGNGAYSNSGFAVTKNRAWNNGTSNEYFTVDYDGTTYNFCQMSFTPTEDCSVRFAFSNKCVGHTYPDYNYLFTKEYNPYKDTVE